MPRNYFINEGNKIGHANTAVLGKAQEALTAKSAVKKGQCVAIAGDWQVEPTTDENATKFIGIAFHDANAGELVMVDTEGFVKLDPADTILAGAELTPTADGKVKTATTGNRVIGTAVAGATTSDVVFAKLR